MEQIAFERLKAKVQNHFSNPAFASEYLKAGLASDRNLDGVLTPSVFSQLFLVERPESTGIKQVIGALFKDTYHNLLWIESHRGSGKSIFLETTLFQQLSGAYIVSHIDLSQSESYIDFGDDIGDSDQLYESRIFQIFRKMYRRACKNEGWMAKFLSLLNLIVDNFAAFPSSAGYIEILAELSKQMNATKSFPEYFIGHSQRIWKLQDNKKTANVILLLYLLLLFCDPASPDRKCVIVFDNVEAVVRGSTDRIAIIIQQTVSFLSQAFSSINMEEMYYTRFTAIISARSTSNFSYALLSQSPSWSHFGHSNEYVFALPEYDFSGLAILKKLRYLVDIGGNNTPLFARCMQVASLIMPRRKIEEWLSTSSTLIDIGEAMSKHIMTFFRNDYRRLIDHLCIIVEKDVEYEPEKIRNELGTISILQRIDAGYEPTTDESIFLRNTLELSFGRWYLPNYDRKDPFPSSLPASITRLTALESIDISNSSIANLPDSIGNLVNLRSLSLSNTRVNKLPDSICNLASLRSLCLGGTTISALPDSIRALNRLESLDISDTRIQTLPHWIGDLPRLQHLNLAGLSIREIPESLGLCGLHFVEDQSFSADTQGINLYGVMLLDQDKTIFLESPDLIPGLYIKHATIPQGAMSNYDAQAAIDSFFGEVHNSLPSFSSFVEYINGYPNQVIRSYVARNYPALFKFEPNGANLIPSNSDENIQNLLYQLFLVDSGYIIVDEKPMVNAITLNLPDKSDNLVDTATDQDSKDLSDDKLDESPGPEPNEVEKATKIVLESFNTWLINNTEYRINKRAKRQFAGVQYGYDVGTNMRSGKALFRLCFECKRLNQLKPLNDNNPGEIKIRSYSYNFLQFYMYCPRTMNNRWILVSPYGELQNEFEENLIQRWNDEHTFLKIHAITQTSTTLTCKRFFSVDEEAFHLIYPNEKCPEEDQEDIFSKIMDFIGEDCVGDKLQEKLNDFPFWQTYGYHDTLLPIRTIEKADSFDVVLSHLKRFSNVNRENTTNCNGRGIYEDEQHGIFIVGNAGTGKSWITYQIVEELILNQSSYHLLPIYIELRSLNITEKMDCHERRNVINEKKAEILKKQPTLRTQKETIVFVLDGFDEMLSGLSKTDIKVTFLREFVSSLSGSFNSPLFVITSRESDYVACKSHREFGEIVRRFTLVQLDHESCTESDIKSALEKLAQKHIDLSSQILKLASNNQLLKIMRRPFFFGLLIDFVALTRSIVFENEKRIDEYTVLKTIVDDTARDRGISRNDRDEWNRLALKMTQENLTAVQFIPEKHSDEGLKLFTIIETDEHGTRRIAFRHNILREYFVGEYLFNELSANNTELGEKRITDNSFLHTIRQTPLCPEVERAFMAFVHKSSNFIANTRQLRKLVCREEIKKDPGLSTTLLEILLQPGSDLSGTADAPLDLSGIHTENLLLWNCGLQYINLQNAVMQNLQLVDVRLSNIDLRNADLTGLHVFSNHPIIGATNWYAHEKWHIAAVNAAGQCIEYSLDSLDYEDRYTVKISGNDIIINQFEELSGASLTYFNGAILHCNGILLYDLLNQNLLYKLGPNQKKLRRVLPFHENNTDGTYFLIETNTGVSNVVFLGNKTSSQELPMISPNMVSFVDSNNTVYLHNGKMLLRSGCHDIILEDQCGDVECFTAFKTGSGLSVVMMKQQLIRVIIWDGQHVSKKQLITENGNSHCIQCIFLQRIANNTYMACSKTKLYLLLLSESTYRAVELKASVESKNLMLEDEAGNRMKDDVAYRLLHG